MCHKQKHTRQHNEVSKVLRENQSGKLLVKDFESILYMTFIFSHLKINDVLFM